nr:MAG TPA: hypothetical protein [Caudoviricetes sp.]
MFLIYKKNKKSLFKIDSFYNVLHNKDIFYYIKIY